MKTTINDDCDGDDGDDNDDNDDVAIAGIPRSSPSTIKITQQH